MSARNFINFVQLTAFPVGLFALSNDSKEQNDLAVFLQELEETQQDTSVLSKSYDAAKKSITTLYKLGLSLPQIEIYPQGYIAYTWRKERTGILNIAFNEKGTATYVAYLGDNENAIKGEFSTVIPNEVISLIRQITEV